jgi:hypothetical protein
MKRSFQSRISSGLTPNTSLPQSLGWCSFFENCGAGFFVVRQFDGHFRDLNVQSLAVVSFRLFNESRLGYRVGSVAVIEWWFEDEMWSGSCNVVW